MDYNIEPGIGTDYKAESPGQGLLEHERAYLEWLDHIFEKYPELVIENCSSGGLRMDYAMLSRCSIQSMSDQEDYRNFATIAANAATGAAMEQAAVWSYPIRNGSQEEVIYNMVNAMLLRVHQSGHLAELSKECKELVKEGILCYKKIRKDIGKGLPFWPLDLAGNLDTWLTFGIYTDKTIYLAVWKRNADTDEIEIPLQKCKVCSEQKNLWAECIYPQDKKPEFSFDQQKKVIKVRFEKPVMARLFRICGGEK